MTLPSRVPALCHCPSSAPFPPAAEPSSAAAASRGNASVPPFHLRAGSRLKIHHFRGREGAREERERGAGGAELGAHSKPSRTWPGGVSSADGAGAGLQPPLGLSSWGCEVTRAGQEQDHECSAPWKPQPSCLQPPAAMGSQRRGRGVTHRHAPALPCLRTGSPKSPSSRTMEGFLVTQNLPVGAEAAGATSGGEAARHGTGRQGKVWPRGLTGIFLSLGMAVPQEPDSPQAQPSFIPKL